MKIFLLFGFIFFGSRAYAENISCSLSKEIKLKASIVRMARKESVRQVLKWYVEVYKDKASLSYSIIDYTSDDDYGLRDVLTDLEKDFLGLKFYLKNKNTLNLESKKTVVIYLQNICWINQERISFIARSVTDNEAGDTIKFDLVFKNKKITLIKAKTIGLS